MTRHPIPCRCPHHQPHNLPSHPNNNPKNSSTAISSAAPIQASQERRAATDEHDTIEPITIFDEIKHDPFIFISSCHVPATSAMVQHLKNRLAREEWREIRCDRTGYYIVFENSNRGTDACVRCFETWRYREFFTYILNMKCYRHGNPNPIHGNTIEFSSGDSGSDDSHVEHHATQGKGLPYAQNGYSDHHGTYETGLDCLDPYMGEACMSVASLNAARLKGPDLSLFGPSYLEAGLIPEDQRSLPDTTNGSLDLSELGQDAKKAKTLEPEPRVTLQADANQYEDTKVSDGDIDMLSHLNATYLSEKLNSFLYTGPSDAHHRLSAEDAALYAFHG